MIPIPQITDLPDPPRRGQDDELFAQLADAFMDALPQFRDELNAFGAALIAATIERVVNEAAISFEGARGAAMTAIAARDAAQGYAASIDPSKFVKLIGDQAIDGGKTFAQKIIATLGIRIGNVDLTALTAAGKALIEAADAAAQRAALELPTTLIQDFPSSGTYTKPAGAKAVQLIMWGGGGGGSAGAPQLGGAGTGGAGGWYLAMTLAAADVPASVAVTIGAGGGGGAVGGAGIGSGGNTLFGSLAIAYGGEAAQAGGSPRVGGLLAGGHGGSSGGAGGNVGIPDMAIAAPCPGGGSGGFNNYGAGAGGVGALRGAAALRGGGGAPGGNNSGGSNGAARIGAIPGTAGGGGGAGAFAGGAGGSGAGGGGGGALANGENSLAGPGGAGGAGFCRVITYF